MIDERILWSVGSVIGIIVIAIGTRLYIRKKEKESQMFGVMRI